MADPATVVPVLLRQRDGDAPLQYYIAVDRQQYKMGTLVDLLEVLGKKGGLPLSICCSARDSLDAVSAAMIASQHFTISTLHSDLADNERALNLESFRKSIAEWTRRAEDALLGAKEATSMRLPSHLLVMTDACLPSNALGESSLSGRVMINYDLPSKKEAYMRRIGACLGHAFTPLGSGISTVTGGSGIGGVIINVVVGGEVGTLRTIEDSCGVIIEEMPIHISELIL
eukprot:TRINITY_DN8439_c0_g1_i1.p1 TRINITY_DN8439_c0_g1~~TRINITY_DN8439_c0_g1_i1.p1  ORF type:complete len:229 (+),score=25.65 TRINITY_DN8439_c0_g1_i1:126-812(+)